MAQVKIPRTLAGMAQETARLLHDPRLLVWALFVFLIPFYVFSSGLPQPGDILLIPLVLLALRAWNGRLDRSIRRPFSILLVFTVWVIIVDWGWALVLGNFGLFGPDTFLLFPIYYVYNTLVFLIVCVLYQRYGARFLWLTLHVVLLSVLVQAAASLLIHREHAFRGAGFFNNPNQLGFFALVSASILALGKRSLGLGTFKTGLGLTLCSYLALVSASRAAVIGIAILFALTVISSPRQIVVAALLIGGLAALGGPLSHAFEGTQQRLTANRYPQFSFFEERGYDRILANKQYWFLGAGEGGTSRFVETTLIGATEIHSSLGTIFFCYGIVGILIFLAFLLRVVERASLRSMLMLLPTLSYTIAHQGLRSTPVWILFGVFVCLKHSQRVAPTAPRIPARAADRLKPAS
ncbi:MAG TPA: hypothetical protein VGD37_36785 [Kofleriaceae bacterium]